MRFMGVVLGRPGFAPGLRSAFLTRGPAFGKPAIKAKTSFCVNDLHGGLRLPAGLDAASGTVDNHGFAEQPPVQCGRCENKFSTMNAELWQRGCERLAAELPEQQFNTWIRPLPAADVTDQGPGGAIASEKFE